MHVNRKLGLLTFFSLSLPRVAFSRVEWFSRALAFRLLYYPWGKMGDYFVVHNRKWGLLTFFSLIKTIYLRLPTNLLPIKLIKLPILPTFYISPICKHYQSNKPNLRCKMLDTAFYSPIIFGEIFSCKVRFVTLNYFVCTLWINYIFGNRPYMLLSLYFLWM